MNGKSFLAIGQTHESTESTGYKKYIGIGSSFVLGVNPTKEELETIYNTTIENEPEYKIEKDDTHAEGIRVEFVVRTDPQVNNGIETTIRVPFFLYNEPRYNKNKTKIQVIDAYGNVAFVSVEDAKENKQPVDANGKNLKIASSYRVAYRGEADLVKFLKCYLGIHDAFQYVNSTDWVLKTDTSDCIFGLEHIKDYFSGDVSEVKEALALREGNKLKLTFGIRTTDRGQFQTVATREEFVFKNNERASTFTRAENSYTKAKLAGMFTNVEYRFCPLQEYTLEATNLAEPATTEEDNPLGDPSEMPWD